MKIKKSIFTKLIICFIVYAGAIIFTFILCSLLSIFVMGNGNVASVRPDQIIDDNGNVVNLDITQKVGGWVEELDENYNVVHVYGDKLTDENAYTLVDIFEITSAYGETDYVGFFVQPKNSSKQFLCMYDRKVMTLTPTIMLNEVDSYMTPDFTMLFVPLCIIEIILISFYLKRKIKKPLDEIIDGMSKLKAGDDGARINVKTEAEFEEIIETFNSMANELQLKKEENESLTKKKNQMLLELSHDIKTPVATIKSYANALEEGLVPKEKIEDTYRLIDAKAGRVQNLTDDMFMMLKMDNPDYKLKFEKVNLSEYLRQLCAEYYNEITESGFEFEIDIPETEIEADIDSVLFSRVVGNLLSNAKKYNSTGSKISVSLLQDKESVVLSVCDDGEEIDSAFAEQMFSAFSRGDKARKTDGGTGLGLAISKVIIDKHGGELEYKRAGDENVFEVRLNRE